MAVITSARYLSRIFLSRFGLLLLAFLVLIEIFDMMAAGDQVISRNNSVLALFQYSALRVPEILTQSLPFSVLLGALLTLAGLAQNNEIIVLKSVGISFFQLLAMMAPAALVIGVGHFLLADQVVPKLSPRVEQLLDPENRADKANNEDDTVDAGIWLRDETAVVSMERASQDGHDIENVTVFERDENGKLKTIMRAHTGHFEDGRWTLQGVRILVPGEVERDVPEMRWTTRLRPAQLSSLAAHPSVLSIKQIMRFIRRPEIGARPVHVYATWLQQRISLVLKPLLMILLAAPAANITRRQVGMAGTLGYGIAAGFGYFVADGLGLAFGEAGKLPALIAVWVPGLIFAAFGGYIVLQVER